MAITVAVAGLRSSSSNSGDLSPIPFRNIPFNTHKKFVDPKQTVRKRKEESNVTEEGTKDRVNKGKEEDNPTTGRSEDEAQTKTNLEKSSTY